MVSVVFLGMSYECFCLIKISTNICMIWKGFYTVEDFFAEFGISVPENVLIVIIRVFTPSTTPFKHSVSILTLYNSEKRWVQTTSIQFNTVPKFNNKTKLLNWKQNSLQTLRDLCMEFPRQFSAHASSRTVQSKTFRTSENLLITR